MPQMHSTNTALLQFLTVFCALQLSLAFNFTPVSTNNFKVASPNSVRMQASSGDRAEIGKTKVIFVCLGNICRSPTAEAVFDKKVQDAGRQDQFFIESCGTGGGSADWYMQSGFSYHEGESPDRRMTAAASNRGITLCGASRPLTPEDLDIFDYIIAMDGSNKQAITEAASYWGKSAQAAQKTKMMTSYCKKFDMKSVPDPYYGGAQGFETVLDILEDACTGLLESIPEPSTA
uniref:Phosphotyrosine protein phosphatase I domain-containing protein n=1 Tax=Fibrocapsa japonica TaxID=94617 RepID=A0A7S2XZB6_9STRA|mmetsp:Transcript_24320/g.35377  ORF Transcript_24320/g.35377 Transcript_24320/m.35377 type:complete len:233 (+) Transcript_24320:83-781(+)|eukprot:CAMPEP_0113942284 /NCGR_PEP_ID=MMETSP1339-20121228/8026_1 /TAXON_ID=94617 /ORGANISM="Fibrocapsa japonica" /LENGTH=232 /DNA_ID=CAMNT_0000946687 /DNA_START=61 /DNA_END=759 /DNA_ORIENTATION=- /assembly_acc=CAM_ASM_000762